MHLSNVPTTEIADPSSLMLIWKDITHALISAGHGAVLHQELNSRTGQSPNDHEPCNGVARSGLLQQSPAHRAENISWTNELDSGEESTISSLDESDSDEDIYEDLMIPSYIIHDAADLAQCHARPLQDFEEILAQEEAYMRCEEQSAKDVIPVESMSMSNTPFGDAHEPPLTTSIPTADSGHNELQDAAAPAPQVEGRDGLEENTTLPLKPAPASQSGHPTKVGGLRVSDKKDLIPAQVPVVADLLISKDSISYFRDIFV
jgi:hypothetical protein